MKKRKKSAESKERKANWKEYMATVEDIQNFLMDRVLLRHNVITGRVEYRFPENKFWESLECRTESLECRSGNEIHAAQQSMAMQSVSEDGSVDSSGQYF